MLYTIENACKWLGLQKEYGMWHIIHIKFIRWSKNAIIAEAIASFKILF